MTTHSSWRLRDLTSSGSLPLPDQTGSQRVGSREDTRVRASQRVHGAGWTEGD